MTTQKERKLEKLISDMYILELEVTQELKAHKEVLEKYDNLKKQLEAEKLNFGWTQWGEIGFFASSENFSSEDFLAKYKLEALKEMMLEDFCAYLENTTNGQIEFSVSDPEAITINHKGEVFQDGKHLELEADTRAELYEMIEAHMEKTGCFPGVYSVNVHGGIMPINTQKEK